MMRVTAAQRSPLDYDDDDVDEGRRREEGKQTIDNDPQRWVWMKGQEE